MGWGLTLTEEQDLYLLCMLRETPTVREMNKKSKQKDGISRYTVH